MNGAERRKKLANLLIAVTAVVVIALLAMLGIVLKNRENREALKNVKFIAHRGLSSKHYENSEEAFLAAAKSDFFYGIETDIYFTADNVALCSHDENPFADKSLKITSSEYDKIKDLPLKKDDYGFTRSGLCTFEKYLQICADYGKVAVIELKQWSMTDEQLKSVIDKAESICGKDFVIISFSRKNIQAVKEIDEEVVTQHLVENAENLRSSLHEGFNVSDYFRYVTKTLVAEAHGKGRKIGVWTINDLSEARRCAEYGVDFITTDRDFSKEW